MLTDWHINDQPIHITGHVYLATQAALKLHVVGYIQHALFHRVGILPLEFSCHSAGVKI
jgi:hypothetical protein